MKFLSLTLLLVTIAFAMAAPQQAIGSEPEQSEMSASQSTTEEVSASTEEITTPVAEKNSTLIEEGATSTETEEITTPAAEEVTSKCLAGNIKCILNHFLHKTKEFFMNNSQHFIH